MKRVVSPGRRVILISGFLLAFLLILNLSTYALYTRAKDYLDVELGERLRSIAVTLSHAVQSTTAGTLDSTTVSAELYTLLHTVRSDNQLSNIVILTPGGKTVVDLGDVSAVGEPNPFIELDFSAFTLARSGLPAYTNLYRSGDLYMKSAYAPVTSLDNNVLGILGVEAGAAYFDVLRALSNAIIFVDVAGVIVIVVLGLFFYHQSLSLDRAQAAVLQGENLATMGRMVAGIAHEIRNPLSIIKTSAERLERKYDANDDILSYISEEVDRLDHILTGYLDFAKAEKGDLRDYSLQQIIKRCIMILDPEFRSRSIDIVKHFPTEDIMVHVDDKRIQQAVINVLLNAAQAVSDGGSIEITLNSGSRHAAVLIKDSGAGIPRKNLRDITKPFFTTKERGSGLGMSIVATIVEDHDGTLEIKSRQGRGTEVSMTFPKAKNLR